MINVVNKSKFSSLEERLKYLSNKTFSVIELIEVAGISEQSFKLIRKKLLDIGNDIKRLEDDYRVGE